MAEPNYAFNPSVASWVHAMSLAGSPDPESDLDDSIDALDPSEYYKPAASASTTGSTAASITATASAHTTRAPARSTPRSVSGPVSPTPSARSPPALSNKVKALAERFERSPGGSSVPSAVRSRSRDPTRTSTYSNHSTHSVPSMPSAPPATHTSSPQSTHDSIPAAAQPPKGVTYGSYKFTNLKPRERPQPAPAPPSAPTSVSAVSPRSTRRTTGSRSSIDHQLSPSNKSVASSNRRPGSGGRPLFFGEILSEQDATMPGYMIPTMASTAREVQSPASDPIMEEPLEPPADEPLLSAATFSPPARNGHSIRSVPQPTLQPPSRIPIVSRRSRRSSIGSDSGSSAHSVKYTPTTRNYSNRSSPTRVNRRPVGGNTPTEHTASSQQTLPALAYRSHRERGKSPNRVASGPSVPAVVAAQPPPPSPRLRNSRERQPLQPSPGTFSKSSEPHIESGYFSSGDRHTSHHESPMTQTEMLHGEAESQTLNFAFPQNDAESQTLNFVFPQNETESQTLNFAFPQSEQPVHVHDPPPNMEEQTSSKHHQSLSLETLGLGLPPPPQMTSAATDFEESPVLGMPGGFVPTPPAASDEPAPELLQPAVFQTPKKRQSFDFPDFDKSVLGIRESIPIMFNTEKQTDQRQSTSEQWQPTSEYTRQSLQTRSPHRSKDSLRDTDQSHLSIGPLNLDNGTYSVINSVLNLYHQSSVITSDLATFSKNRVYQVSPVIAQHKDWGSKEATETYLARLLSDANASSHRNTKVKNEEAMLLPQLSFGSLHSHENLPQPLAGGTATVFPSQSRRYSRSSRGSITTTIQEDASRSGSSCANRSQDKLSSYTTDNTSASTTGIELPQLAWTNEGLGLSLQNGSTQQNMLTTHSSSHPPVPTHSPPHPPQPIHSPPPPPIQASSIPLPPTQTPNAEQESSTPNFAYAFPEQPQRSPQHQFDGQFEQHPARARTPVSKDYERHLEDRYSTSNQAEGDKPLPRMDTFGEDEPASAENGQSDPAKQALVKRYRILEEMLTTEHQFCIDMMIAHNIFEATAGDIMTEKEKRALFSNCKDLEKFSLSLFRAFKKAAKPVVNYDIPPPSGPWSRDSVDSRIYNPLDSSNNIRNTPEDVQQQFETCTLENDHLTTVGRVFLDNVEKMERLYTTYYLNSQNASAYMKKNQNNPELTGWVSACFEQVENMTQAWDLDSLLVKPGQRLLKYPLLLESLEQASDANHPDLQNIQAARQEILAISGRINEAKKRADTFRAATSEGKKEKKGGKGIGNAFVKAFIPKADKTKAYDEADKIFKDQEYKSREQKFGGHFFQLQIVIRDFENYLDSITEHYNQLNIVFLGFITVCEVAPSVNPEIESTWRKWAMAHFELQNKALEEHKAAVRARVLRPIGDLWEMWVSYQKTIEQRKKFLLHYVKHKQAIDRGEKPDPELVASAEKFTTINDTLKHELPLLYEKTKCVMRNLMTLFMSLQKEWYKTCSKKILPLLESEPQHTTSIRYDLESYVERFNADYRLQQETANRLGIVNQTLLQHISSMTSPVPNMASDGNGSARTSSSRRTESMSSEASVMDARKRNSGGYGPRSQMRSMDGPPRSMDGPPRSMDGPPRSMDGQPRSMDGPPRSSPVGPAYPPVFPAGGATGRPGLGSASLREARALSPTSDASEITLVRAERSNSNRSRTHSYKGFDGTFEMDDRSLTGSSIFDFPPQLGASFLSPTQTSLQTMSSPSSQPASRPGSTRQSGVFNSALPMSESPMRGSVEDLPATPGETEEPEVLFLAASLFEFNIAHDRREGGIPYLVYVPGEIFDVIGMKGELWLARNQDDSTKTVGWIWEKHFARILPEDA